MIRTLIKLAVMLASYFGWWEFFRGRCRMNVYFAPAFTIAFQFTVMFLPGLLNFLPEAAWALYFGGLLLLLDALRREKLGFLKHYANWGYLLFFLAFGVMALAFRGKVVTWFDNFTHWATVVKNMIAAERFPTFAQKAVGFSTYPLGSATIIWYFSRITSDQEDFWMLAQGFMLLCMLLPLFAVRKKNSLLATLFLGIVGHFLLCYNIPLTELLVDTLLPLAGTAMLLIIHRECLRDEEPLDIWYAFPLLFWVMNIKNAGLLFVFAGLVILLSGVKRQKKTLKPLLLVGLALLAGYLLWERHCDYVFYNTIRQHEISMEYFRVRLEEKSPDDMAAIALLLIKTMVMRREMVFLAAALVMLGVMTGLLVPGKKKKYRELAGFLAVGLVAYAISLAAMYIFSMSRDGALELQSVDRYIRVWEITAWYLLAVYACAVTEGVSKEKLVSVLLVLGMLGVRQGCYAGMQYPAQREERAPEDRHRYESLIWEYGIERERSYLFLAEDDRYWYPAFLWGYHLDSNSILQIKVTEASQMEAEKNYDYVVILDENNPVIEQWVAETYPDQAGRAVIQCFK